MRKILVLCCSSTIKGAITACYCDHTFSKSVDENPFYGGVPGGLEGAGAIGGPVA